MLKLNIINFIRVKLLLIERYYRVIKAVKLVDVHCSIWYIVKLEVLSLEPVARIISPDSYAAYNSIIL